MLVDAQECSTILNFSIFPMLITANSFTTMLRNGQQCPTILKEQYHSTEKLKDVHGMPHIWMVEKRHDGITLLGNSGPRGLP